MNRGDWAFPVVPRPDELLSSWLSRSAFAHGQGTHVFCNYHLPGHAIWTRDIDRRPAANTLSCLSEVSGIPVREIRRCTLGAMAGFSRFGPGLGRWPWLLSAGVFHRKRRLHGLQYCPVCLDAGFPYFRREWRLAFMTVCHVHGVPLLDACQACGEPVCPHRSLRYRVECCHSCGRDLAAGTIEADDSGLQHALLQAISGRPVRWRGCDFPYVDFLDTCRILMGKLSHSTITSCRTLFCLTDAGRRPGPASARQFEDMRLDERRHRIETLQVWMEEWPESVLYGARAMGLTQRSFLRTVLPGALAGVLARLSPGQGRRRRPAMTKLVLDAGRRMKRRSPTRYRRAHSQPGAVSRLVALHTAPSLKHGLFGPVACKIEPNHGIMQIMIVQTGEIRSRELFERFQFAADRVGHVVPRSESVDRLPRNAGPGNRKTSRESIGNSEIRRRIVLI